MVKCTEAQIKTSINRLGKGDTAAFDFLVSCNSQAVPALIKLLKHKDENIRIVAIVILGEIGEEATEAIPFFEKVLKDRREENKNSRIMVVNTLAKMGQATVPALIAALKDQDGWVRHEAASALGQIGKTAVPALIAALKDKDGWVRYEAASALGQIGKEAKDAVPALIVALKDRDSWVRSEAASALGQIGQEAKEAVPQLTVAVKNDECSEIREAAIESLKQIAPDEVVSLPASIAEADWRCSPPPPPKLSSKVAEDINRYKTANPPVMCRFLAVKALLSWKCPLNKDNSPPSQPRNSNQSK